MPRLTRIGCLGQLTVLTNAATAVALHVPVGLLHIFLPCGSRPSMSRWACSLVQALGCPGRAHSSSSEA